MMNHRVTKAEALDGHRIAIAWNDGVKGVVDFSDLLERGEAMAPFGDPSRFAEVRVAEHGFSTYWLGPDGSEIGICPDVLRGKADPKVAAWIAGDEREWAETAAAE